MKFLKNIGIGLFFLAVLLVIINSVVRDGAKRETQAQAFEVESKPILTQATEAAMPAAEAYVEYGQRKIFEAMAGGKGPLADAAKQNLANLEQKERIDNRGPRQSMKDCIKPNGLIDQEVKDCMDGLIEKTW
ncbi:hypothetical protein [Pseudomonas sp.]|jgi:hypothetical protein|uniref:hypothetical protein n=1 Tax=Pseudomonas sp. TaxID=306 RepID=UPI0037C56090